MFIVGLGNPGKEYECTHHNIGFMALDEIAKSYNVEFSFESKFQAYVAEIRVNGKKHFLVKPTTYMNLSGHAVRLLMDYYKVEPKDILMIHDDMDFPCGTIHIRKSGSGGGHNGVKSMVKEVGTTDIPRIRVGIGKANKDIVDYVLSKFSKSEMEQLKPAIELMPNICEDFINNGIDYIMNKYN